jgi:hypothetical protein
MENKMNRITEVPRRSTEGITPMLRKVLLRTRWWQWLAAVNLFFISVTVGFVLIPDSSLKWQINSHLTLLNENSVGVWWAGVSLALPALLAWEQSGTQSGTRRRSWQILALILALLSLDEIGSLHERVGGLAGWLGLLPFALLFVGLLIAALVPLYGQPESRKLVYLVLTAFGLFALVALQEYLEHLLPWPLWLRSIRGGVEEGTELLASFLICYGMVYLRIRDEMPRNLLAIVPAPARLPHLSGVIVVSLVIHVVMSVGAVNFSDLAIRGNPSVWFPIMLYLLIGASALWRAYPALQREAFQWQWLVVAVGLVSASVGAMYFARVTLMQGFSFLSLALLGILLVLAGGLLLLLGKLRDVLTLLLLAISAPALITALEIVATDTTPAALLPGLYLSSLLVFLVLLRALVADALPRMSLAQYLPLLIPEIAALHWHSPAVWAISAGILALGSGALFTRITPYAPASDELSVPPG